MANFKISLAACRVNAGFSQKKLSEVLGVSVMTLSHWENGRIEPPYSVVRRISELSGVPMDYIFVHSD